TENILDVQSPRNRRLAEAFANCGLIERSGDGMNKMFERSVQQSKPLPMFSGTSDFQVYLTLHGNITNAEFIRFLEKVGEETLKSFTTVDMLVLDCLQKQQLVPEKYLPRIANLIDLEVVERIGRG